MGRTDARAGTGTAGFQSLLRCVGEGWCWAKLSGAHRLSLNAPDYPDARPFHEALVKANPERLVWGGDWPHPRVEGEMPDAGHLFELFQQWTPDKATQQRILVTNPAKLYGFPKLKAVRCPSTTSASSTSNISPTRSTPKSSKPGPTCGSTGWRTKARKPTFAPILSAAHAYQIGAARDETRAAFPCRMTISCGARRTC